MNLKHFFFDAHQHALRNVWPTFQTNTYLCLTFTIYSVTFNSSIWCFDFILFSKVSRVIPILNGNLFVNKSQYVTYLQKLHIFLFCIKTVRKYVLHKCKYVVHMAKYIPNSFFDKIFLRLGKKAKLN